MIFNVSDTVDKFKILSLGVLTIMVPSKETIQNHKDIEFYYVRLSLSLSCWRVLACAGFPFLLWESRDGVQIH
jgi:hypothetical protein